MASIPLIWYWVDYRRLPLPVVSGGSEWVRPGWWLGFGARSLQMQRKKKNVAILCELNWAVRLNILGRESGSG